jgi:hypothetical protein
MSNICHICSKYTYNLVIYHLDIFKNESVFIDGYSLQDRFMNSLMLHNYIECFNYFTVYSNSHIRELLNAHSGLCKSCSNDLSNKHYNLLKYRYIIDSIKSYQYNLLVNKYLDLIQSIFDGVLESNTHYTVNTLKEILKNSLKYLRINPPKKSIYWRGSDWYYIKIFKIPRVLDNLSNENINIHYDNRHPDFSDSICGHPMASNGWLYESMEILRMNGINFN